ncbi:MAG TPA: hypothetical protein EYP22_04935 [Methanosarcinales archaeon]|nr:hypothetical protein [Methanosarcinales archaeon]
MLFTTKQTSLLKYSAKLAPNNILRVPVVSKEGKPLMPTKASRARKWIKSGKAVKRWSKTGLFYIQLQVEPSRPSPDSFTPPKGATSVEINPALTPTIPYSSASETRQILPIS